MAFSSRCLTSVSGFHSRCGPRRNGHRQRLTSFVRIFGRFVTGVIYVVFSTCPVCATRQAARARAVSASAYERRSVHRRQILALAAASLRIGAGRGSLGAARRRSSAVTEPYLEAWQRLAENPFGE